MSDPGHRELTDKNPVQGDGKRQATTGPGFGAKATDHLAIGGQHSYLVRRCGGFPGAKPLIIA
jgi:hypothetical protein